MFGDDLQEFAIQSYNNAPYLAAFITCGVKAAAADLIAQSQSNQAMAKADETISGSILYPSTINLPRNLAYVLYGGTYQGITQEFLFNHTFPTIFGTATTFPTVAVKVAVDMLVLGPFVSLPMAYLTKSIIYNHTPEEAIHRYSNDVKERNLLIKYWSIWCPVQFCTFSVIPEHMRIVFMACISFFWLVILSKESSME